MTGPRRPPPSDEAIVLPAPWVAGAAGPHGLVLADLRGGGPVELSGPAEAVWRAVGRGRSVRDVVRDVVQAHPAEDPGVVGEQARAFLGELVVAGYLVGGDRRRSGDRGLRGGGVARGEGHEAPLEGDAQGG